MSDQIVWELSSIFIKGDIYENECCGMYSFIFLFFSDLVPIKRESSRRKAKEGNLAKKHMQERLLEDDEEGGLPGKYLK